MGPKLFSRSVLPFSGAFLALILATVIIDWFLHSQGLAYWGRWAGPLGVLVLALSFGYSARKRKFLFTGSMPAWLRFHEYLSWLGALLIMVHSGIHLHAWLPWAATVAMLAATASGLVGKYLLQSARNKMKAAKAKLAAQGLSEEEIEDQLLADSLTLKTLANWRKGHMPVTYTFFFLALFHVVSIFFFLRW